MASFRRTLCALSVVFVFAAVASSQPAALEQGKRAYFEGRFEECTQLLQPLLSSLSDGGQLRETTFFLGLSNLALGSTAQATSFFESAVRHEPAFEPSSDLFAPNVVEAYRDVRSGMTGTLRVGSEPAGAAPIMSGNRIGTTPFEGVALSGDQLIRLELAGHTTAERRVTIRAGEVATLDVTLQSTADVPAGATSTGTQTSDGGGGPAVRPRLRTGPLPSGLAPLPNRARMAFEVAFCDLKDRGFFVGSRPF